MPITVIAPQTELKRTTALRGYEKLSPLISRCVRSGSSLFFSLLRKVCQIVADVEAETDFRIETLTDSGTWRAEKQRR